MTRHDSSPKWLLSTRPLGGFQPFHLRTQFPLLNCREGLGTKITQGMGVWLKQSKVHLVGGWTTPLKNISQNGNLPQIGVRIKNIWNHQPVHSLRWERTFSSSSIVTIQIRGIFWPSVPTPQSIHIYTCYHVPMLRIESTLLFSNIF